MRWSFFVFEKISLNKLVDMALRRELDLKQDS